jgi:hypothetical protein
MKKRKESAMANSSRHKSHKAGKGQIIDWEVTVNEKEDMYFTVRMTWENQVTRQFHYQFNTETEFWKCWDKFLTQHPTKQILDELFTEVVKSYAGRNMVENERAKHSGV